MLLVEKKWVLSQPGQGKKVMMTTGLFFTSHVGTEVAYEHSLTIGTSTQSFLSLLEIIRPLAKRTGERSSKGLALKTARPPANICPTCLKPSLRARETCILQSSQWRPACSPGHKCGGIWSGRFVNKMLELQLKWQILEGCVQNLITER